MEFPLINKELLPPLRLGHGLFNFSIVLLFFYTARFGLLIRRAREKGEALPSEAVRRHRKLGPILAGLCPLGFAAGLALVFIDTGDLLEHPAHLAVGALIVVLVMATSLVSRQITSPAASSFRQTHFRLGLVILVLYLLEVLLGLGVLL